MDWYLDWSQKMSLEKCNSSCLAQEQVFNQNRLAEPQDCTHKKKKANKQRSGTCIHEWISTIDGAKKIRFLGPAKSPECGAPESLHRDQYRRQLAAPTFEVEVGPVTHNVEKSPRRDRYQRLSEMLNSSVPRP